jgi:archaellum biogenesis ATPase FlaH
VNVGKKREDRMGIAIVKGDGGKGRRIFCKLICWGSTGKRYKSD